MSAVIHLPVFGMLLTIAVYVAAYRLHQAAGRSPLLTPVLVSVIVIAVILQLVGLPYAEYLRQCLVLTLLLGPATVALALPLLNNGRALLSSALPVAVTLLVGGAVSVAITVGALTAFGVDTELLLAALPRSVTSPVGLSIAEVLEASVPLAVTLTLISGVAGAVLGPALLTLTRVRDERARGFAIGMTSHGIGTSRVLADSVVSGGWSSAGMVLNALAMTVALPIVAAVLAG